MYNPFKRKVFPRKYIIQNEISCNNKNCIHFYKEECLYPNPQITSEANAITCYSDDYGEKKEVIKSNNNNQTFPVV